MTMPAEKFRELFASLTTSTPEHVQDILDCADIYQMSADQQADVHALKLAHQKAELRKRGR